MRQTTVFVMVFSAASIVFGQTESKTETRELTPEKKAAGKRLDYMFNSSAGFVGRRASDGAALKIFPEPLLRFTNPLFGCREGLFVAWVDPNNRPVAAGQVFLMRGTENDWWIETQSLCEGPMDFTSKSNAAWTPREPGIVWQRFGTKTMKPAESRAVRLGQMRRLARRFGVEDDLSTKANVLRLMPNPMVRYEDNDNRVIDGALFAFVEGTDPELLVLIEARVNEKGDREFWWSLAAMSSAKLEAFLDGNRVWSKPSMSGSQSTTFYMRRLTGGVPYPLE